MRGRIFAQSGAPPSRGWMWAAWGILLTAALFPIRIDGYINIHDEGVWLAALQAALEGKKLYAQVWFQYGPLLLWPFKEVAMLSAPTLSGVRLTSWALNVLGLCVAYAALLRHVRLIGPRLLFSLFLWLVPAASHAPCIPMSARYGLAFLPLCFWPTADTMGFPLWAGLCSGIVCWASQEAAPALLVAGCCVFWTQRPRSAIPRFLLGFAGAFGAGLAGIALYCGVRPYVQTAILGIGRLVVFERLPFPKLTAALALAAWENNADFLAAILPPLSYVAALFIAWRGRSLWPARRRTLAALALFGLLMLLPAWGRSDRWHLYIALSPIFLVWGYATEIAWRRSRALGLRVLFAFCALGALMTLPHYEMRVAKDRWLHATSRRTALARAGRSALPFAQANGYEFLVEWIQRHTVPGEPVLFYPYNGAIYFLADRPNPTRFPILAYAIDARMQEAAMRDLESTKPQWVIIDRDNSAFDGVPIARFLGRIDAYLRAHYAPQVAHGPFVFMKRENS